jgi:hypothetical protein
MEDSGASWDCFLAQLIGNRSSSRMGQKAFMVRISCIFVQNLRNNIKLRNFRLRKGTEDTAFCKKAVSAFKRKNLPKAKTGLPERSEGGNDALK